MPKEAHSQLEVAPAFAWPNRRNHGQRLDQVSCSTPPVQSASHQINNMQISLNSTQAVRPKKKQLRKCMHANTAMSRGLGAPRWPCLARNKSTLVRCCLTRKRLELQYTMQRQLPDCGHQDLVAWIAVSRVVPCNLAAFDLSDRCRRIVPSVRVLQCLLNGICLLQIASIGRR